MSSPRPEIYNFRTRYQVAISVALYRSLAKDRFWPKAAVDDKAEIRGPQFNSRKETFGLQV